MAERIGLFGGTFDPPHNGHLALARTARDALQLRELRWLPAGQPWQKAGRTVTPALHRAAMVQLAIAGEPEFVNDRSEIERAGPTYTIDTVEALRAAEPGAECVLILGFDQYAGLPGWHRWQELLRLVTVAVAQRPGAPVTVPLELQALAHHMLPLAMPPRAVSSSAVRQAFAAGADVSQLVPPEVARYIEINGLYRGPNRS